VTNPPPPQRRNKLGLIVVASGILFVVKRPFRLSPIT
jgi:hypothetical protein